MKSTAPSAEWASYPYPGRKFLLPLKKKHKQKKVVRYLYSRVKKRNVCCLQCPQVRKKCDVMLPWIVMCKGLLVWAVAVTQPPGETVWPLQPPSWSYCGWSISAMVGGQVPSSSQRGRGLTTQHACWLPTWEEKIHSYARQTRLFYGTLWINHRIGLNWQRTR